MHIFPLAHNEEIGIDIENEENFVLEVNYLSSLMLELEIEGYDINHQKDKIKIMLEIIHGKRDFRQRCIFFVPLKFQNDLVENKSNHVLILQYMKKWVAESLRKGVSPMTELPTELPVFLPY